MATRMALAFFRNVASCFDLLTVVSEKLTASVIMTISSSETSVSIYHVSKCSNQEDSHICTKMIVVEVGGGDGL
jgi:hypothetical protein